jgi:hypothetical protein
MGLFQIFDVALTLSWSLGGGFSGVELGWSLKHKK